MQGQQLNSSNGYSRKLKEYSEMKIQTADWGFWILLVWERSFMFHMNGQAIFMWILEDEANALNRTKKIDEM